MRKIISAEMALGQPTHPPIEVPPPEKPPKPPLPPTPVHPGPRPQSQ